MLSLVTVCPNHVKAIEQSRLNSDCSAKERLLAKQASSRSQQNGMDTYA